MNRPALITLHASVGIILLFMTAVFGCRKSAELPEVAIERARILMDRNQAAEAVALLDEAVAAMPKNAEARYQRGVACETLGALEKALSDYTECLKLDSGRTDALNNKAVVLAKMKRFEEAAVEFGRLIDLNPQEALSYRNRGLCHVDLGNNDAALADYAKALELSPTDPAGWFQRGIVYLKQGRLTEAEQDFTKAIELEPELAKAWMNRGIARYKRGEKQLAAEDLEKAQDLDDNIVVPDVGFMTDDSPAASTGTAQTELTWSAVRTVAEAEMANRGFTNLKLVREFPSFLCGEFSGEFEGKPRTILVTCSREDEGHLTLPSKAPADAAEECSLLVLQVARDSGSPPVVSQFEAQWAPL